MLRNLIVLLFFVFLSGSVFAAGSEMCKVKKGQIELSSFIVRNSNLSLQGGSFRCGWFSGQTWHLLIEPDGEGSLYYTYTKTNTGRWLKLTLYIDDLTIKYNKQKIPLAEGSSLSVAKGWVLLKNGESFNLAGVGIVVGQQHRQEATYRTDKYKQQQLRLFVGLFLLVLIVIVIVKGATEAAQKAEAERKKKEQQEALQKAEEEKKRKRQEEIKGYYRRMWARIREVGESQNIRGREISDLLRQFEQEFQEKSRNDFVGVWKTDYFWARGWDLIFELADQRGIAVCYKCKTINPTFCQNHHCQECYASKDGHGCLLCAEGRGYNICLSCRKVNPERCPCCGSCGCLVSIYGGYCSSCD